MIDVVLMVLVFCLTLFFMILAIIKDDPEFQLLAGISSFVTATLIYVVSENPGLLEISAALLVVGAGILFIIRTVTSVLDMLHDRRFGV